MGSCDAFIGSENTFALPPVQEHVQPIELLRMLDADEASRHTAISCLQGRVLSLSLDNVGCRVIQRALEVCSTQQQIALIGELHGSVLDLVWSPHGNYVVQKIINLSPSAHSSFIPQELAGTAGDVARAKFGCRVIMRLFEQSVMDTATLAIVDELLLDATAICRHEFAHHTIETLLKFGLPEHRHAIAETLLQNLWENARDRSATYVIKAVFGHCGWEDRCALVEGLMKKGEYGFRLLKASEWGIHVLKTLRWVVNQHPEITQGLNINPRDLQALFRIVY